MAPTKWDWLDTALLIVSLHGFAAGISPTLLFQGASVQPFCTVSMAFRNGAFNGQPGTWKCNKALVALRQHPNQLLSDKAPKYYLCTASFTTCHRAGEC